MRNIVDCSTSTTSVIINDQVLACKSSDHSILSFVFQDKVLISSNVMCSGDLYLNRTQNDAIQGKIHFANSFRIDPRDPQGQRQRITAQFNELKRTIVEQSTEEQKPIVALQEFPKNPQTGLLDFTSLVEDELPDYTPYFGNTEENCQQSQLCMLVPNDCKVTEFAQSNERIQVLFIDNVAYMNIHPSPRTQEEKSGPINIDPFQSGLKTLANQLLQEKKCRQIHILGDWNRKYKELEPFWGSNSIHSPPKPCHLPPGGYEDSAMPKPIDHCVSIVSIAPT
ncbi:MAG: hypothetical protein LLF94_03245 [Chlamydiales bacterium]|nr:hypothetical protein [Chlamydiales bacterium]